MFLSAANVYSQIGTRKLLWTPKDSLEKVVLNTPDLIAEWGEKKGRYVSVDLRSFNIQASVVHVLLSDVCSGLRCYFIDVFKKEGDQYELIQSSFAQLMGALNVEVDDDKEELVFRSGSDIIGKLSFNELGL